MTVPKRLIERFEALFDSVAKLSFSETYCGGYSGEDPPLPIPNREVKLTIADGTAPPGGRVGSCHFYIRAPDVDDIGGFSYVKVELVHPCLRIRFG